ncbi:MAG: outer membrane lipoprotein-sorting protein [Pseudomonadota bacterium]
MLLKITIKFITIFFLIVTSINAQESLLESRGLKIIRESENKTEAMSEKIIYDMVLYRDDKVVHEREMLRFFKKNSEEKRMLVKFSAPPSIKNISLLIVDSGDAINDIWSYSPADRKIRRISGSQKQNWFMGTEFTYEDFEGFKFNAYKYEYISTNPCGKWKECHIVDAIPTADTEIKSSGYSKKRYWIESESYYPVIVEYFDKNNKIKKRQVVQNMKYINEYYRPTSQYMINLENKQKTSLIMKEYSINGDIDDFYVSERFLRSR